MKEQKELMQPRGKIVTIASFDMHTYSEPVFQTDARLIPTIDCMIDMLKERKFALGISAIQVGVPLRIVVIDMAKIIPGADKRTHQFETLLNPTIITKEGTSPGIQEACLSVPDMQAEVTTRSSRIHYGWYDTNNVFHEKDAVGLEAVLIQHEIDHLNGILFIDGLSRQVRREAEKKAQKYEQRVPSKEHTNNSFVAEGGVRDQK